MSTHRDPSGTLETCKRCQGKKHSSGRDHKVSVLPADGSSEGVHAGSDTLIRASSLALYFGKAGEPLKDHLESLDRSFVAAGVSSPPLVRGPDGDLLLSLDYATSFLDGKDKDLIWAIAKILISEEEYGSEEEFPKGHASYSLVRFEPLPTGGRCLDPVLLYEFLEIEVCFDCWIQDLFDRLRPWHGYDYGGDTFDLLISEAIDPKTSISDQFRVHIFDLWFSPGFATMVAMAETTRRAALIRMALTETPNPFPFRKSRTPLDLW